MNIRKLPAAEPRVESGPVQFGDDWPGVFIRGDSAAHYAMTLKYLLMVTRMDPIQRAVLDGLKSDLASCVLGPVGEELRNVHIESPAYKVDGDVAITEGQRVRFLTAMPSWGIEIGHTARVSAVLRGDETTLVLAPEHQNGSRITIEDTELWKVELIPTAPR